MRVKLSYTVEEEDVLQEAAKIINLTGEDRQHCVTLFSQVQLELRGGEEKIDPPNVHKSLEMMDEFRKALLTIDMRLAEVAEIVDAYDNYRRTRDDREEEFLSAPPPVGDVPELKEED